MIISFSPNMLKTYQLCPKKFYYQYIEKLNVPHSVIPFEKGKKIHALANYYLQGVNISRIETSLTDDERLVWNLLLENPFFKKDYYKSEYNLSSKVEDFWIGGRIDAIVFEGMNYYILDYKTGSTPKNPQYDYQTMIYLLCLDKYLKNYETISFVYINLRDKNNHVIKFNTDLKNDYEKRIAEICKKINSDTVYQCNTENCKYCEYSKICNK